MMPALPHLTRPDQLEAVQIDMGKLAPWAPTPGQFRDNVLAYGVVGPDFSGRDNADIRKSAPTRAEILSISQAVAGAVVAGRVIDFGYVPNDVIKETCLRAGPLYAAGAFGMPFREPWLFCHGWEKGVSWYLVQLVDQDRPAGGPFEAVELDPFMANGAAVVAIGDRVFLDPTEAVPSMKWSQYPGMAVPAPWRFLEQAADSINLGLTPAAAAAGNVLDPLMTVLMILSTNGVSRETVAPSPALQKARAKRGRPPLPAFDRVDCRGYVTALQARGASAARDGAGGGTHASPVPHLRRGHMRTYANGSRTFVRDSLVNFTDDAKAAWTGRTHYVIDGARP